jgi:hypothetical protein
LSRAFFYAGARALLVSHWAVESNATVKLVTKTLNTMGADKTIGRSEALRRSMVALIEKGAPGESHPSYWAPFVVVGEGAAGIDRMPGATPVAATAAEPASAVVSVPNNPMTAEPPIPTPLPKKAAAAKARPKPKTVDWKKSIFDR